MTASLVVQTSFLGDMVLTTPLVEQLAGVGPVDVVATPANAVVLANNPSVRSVIVYDKHGKDRGLRALFRLAAHIRGRYDTAYLAQGSLRSGALAWAARIPKRVGFATSAGRLFYTRRVAAIRGEHHAVRLLRLASSEGPTPNEHDGRDVRPRLYPGAAERDAVDQLLAVAGASDASDHLVAVAPGSIWDTKRWPHYTDLARRLAGIARVVVVGSDADKPLASAIAGAVHDVIDATGQLSLLASAELIRRARVVVTNDSAPLHLASAMATPTVAIFGPTITSFGFGPLAPRSRVAELPDLPCRPCDSHGPQRCPLGHWRCMRELGSPSVVAMVLELLTSPVPSAQSPIPSPQPHAP